MKNNIKFPTNVFPDITKDSFDKFTKKNVSEDYVVENLRLQGWKVYTPFSDTGIDLIATKTIEGQQIIRYIQVKTRSLTSKNIFGYTLSAKDFREDPRHVFMLYCDSVSDIFTIPIYDYLKFFSENESYGKSHFGSVSFRKENNKINSLKYYPKSDEWKYSQESFEQFKNDKGIERISDTTIEDNFEEYLNDIHDMKIELFYSANLNLKAFNPIKVSDNDSDQVILEKEESRKRLEKQLENMKNMSKEDRNNLFTNIDKKIKEDNIILYESHNRYVY